MTPRTFNNGYRGNNGNIYNMIFLSLVIHLIVITVILISVPTTSRRLTFGMAYSVQLVGPEVILPTKDSSVLKDILQPNEATSSIIIKREITNLASTPIKKEETAKLNIEKAVGAIKQKELAKPETATAASAGGNVPQAQVSSRLDEYTAFINSRIQNNWTLPQALRPRDNVETIIEVRILRNGAVERLNFEKRSGNRYVDDSAMKAVQKSVPFPPFPEGMMDNYIEIGIRFHPSELR
jgi:colicin import membrane protein